MIHRVQERWLRLVVRLTTDGQGLAWALRRAGARLRNDAGQAPTEYLMVVGFMATVVVAVFVYAYWPWLNSSMRYFVWNAWIALTGKDQNKQDIVKGAVKVPPR
jgi:hypothetical protein